MERVEISGRQVRVETRANMNYGLCQSPGTIRLWDAETCKNIFRDIEIGVSDFSHRLKVL